jgi:hypothetical protein
MECNSLGKYSAKRQKNYPRLATKNQTFPDKGANVSRLTKDKAGII